MDRQQCFDLTTAGMAKPQNSCRLKPPDDKGTPAVRPVRKAEDLSRDRPAAAQDAADAIAGTSTLTP